MKTKNEIRIGNLTTIINTISLMLAGVIFGIISAFGLNLPLDEYALSGIIGLIISTAFAYVNAKYHNTFFDEEGDYLKIRVDNLTEEQIRLIQNFVDNATTINITEEIEDIDPSLEYGDGA